MYAYVRISLLQIQKIRMHLLRIRFLIMLIYYSFFKADARFMSLIKLFNIITFSFYNDALTNGMI